MDRSLTTNCDRLARFHLDESIHSLVTVTVLASSIGLHWAVLQSVAWVGMLTSYSIESGIKVALAKTFDGENPCKLCIAVSEGRKTERQDDTVKVPDRIVMFFEPCSVTLFSPETIPGILLPVDVPAPAAFPPPAPPPRRV